MMTADQIREKLRTAVVGIAGCGGLGSNCAVSLARVGVGRLVVADYDVVELTNLNRQYYFADQAGMKKVEALKENIRRIDPGIRVDANDILLDQTNIPRVFDPCQVIVEAFDLAEMKQMIIEAVLGRMPGIPLVSGMGLAGWGANELLRVHVSDRLYICGDGQIEVSEELPPLAPRVGVVANMEANQVLELLLGKM